MKKIILILVAAVALLFGANALATSGACSSHGGVSCSAGPDTDGSVICADGWTDSAVSYSSMSMCGYASSCVAPVAGCTELQYRSLQAQLVGSGSAQYAPVSSSGILRSCRNQIDSYNRRMEEYRQCLSGPSSGISLPNSEWDQAACRHLYGSHSSAIGSSCSCDSGYHLDEHVRCVQDDDAADAYCRGVYGAGGVRYPGMEGYCRCGEGFTMDSVSGKCAAEGKPPVIQEDPVETVQNQAPVAQTVVPGVRLEKHRNVKVLPVEQVKPVRPVDVPVEKIPEKVQDQKKNLLRKLGNWLVFWR